MKTLDLKKTKNHIKLTALVTSDSFGDQVIEIIKENLDGSTECLAKDCYPENNHLSVADIQMVYGGVNQSLDTDKTLNT